MKTFRPGSLAEKIAEGISKGKGFEQLQKELNLKNNVTFYQTRMKMGLGKKKPKTVTQPLSSKATFVKEKRAYKRKAVPSTGIVRIEAIFHSDVGERFRVLCSPTDFTALYGHLLGAKL